MSADRRSVFTDALETLGTIIDENQKRDAIHIAVDPVVAGEDLRPGDHVNVVAGVATFAAPGQGLGIVDPYLIGRVRKGERFWFLMYPRQVRSLRHVWSHPAFSDETAIVPAAKTSPAPKADQKRMREAETFVSNLASTLGSDQQELLDRARAFLDHNDYWSEGGRFEGESIPEEFWDHFEVLTGTSVKSSSRESFLSCSC
jgi:hypothetical protein